MAERPEITFLPFSVGSFSQKAHEEGLTEENEEAAPLFDINYMILY